MSTGREQLIEGLVDDLKPSRGPHRVELLAALWLAASWLVVIAATLAWGPLREGWQHQLVHHPRFLLETGLGWLAGAAAIVCAFRLGVPAPGRPLRRALLALTLLGLWVGAYLIDLAQPALDPSMAGKRDGCAFQVMTFSLPPLMLGLALLRRLAPLDRAFSGAVVGAAAGALPALLMQLGCMYVPEHFLVHHIAPVALLALLGGALGALVLRRV